MRCLTIFGPLVLSTALILAQARRACVGKRSRYHVTLNVPYVRTSAATDFVHCLKQAETSDDIQSFSYSLSTLLCKLFNTSHLSDSAALIPEVNSVYMESPRHPCTRQEQYPCTGNAICARSTSSPKNFYCACPEGFKGIDCTQPDWCTNYVYTPSRTESVSQEPTELARNKPTAQSSTREGDVGNLAAKAVDGLESTVFDHGGCTHTHNETDPWWRVDLKDRYEVFKVAIVNRRDCCWNRLDGFQLTVGDCLDNNGNNNEACIKGGIVGQGKKKEFVCLKPLKGRYVNVMLTGSSRILTLCEVQVFGTPLK